jgi:hypothetical protein
MYAVARSSDSGVQLPNTRPFSPGLAARTLLLQHEAAEVCFRQVASGDSQPSCTERRVKDP